MPESSTPPDRVTVVGSFGLGNAGDEAAYLAVEDLTRALGLATQLDVVGRFPRVDEANIISLGPEDAARRAALRGQPVLYVGGGIIEPRASATVLRVRGLVREVRPRRRDLFAASADPHGAARYDWRVRLALLGALHGCRRVYARDVLSGETMRMLLPHKRVDVVGDSVLWMQPDSVLAPEVAALGQYITVSLAGVWRGDDAWYDWLARQLVDTARELDAAIVFLPFCTRQSDDDRVEAGHIARRMDVLDPGVRAVVLGERPPIRQISTIQEHAVLAIGMRLHACVMAYARRTPVVGLAYHAKIHGFARTVGWERFFPFKGEKSLHGAKRYGFAFADTGLGDCEVRRVAVDAVEHAHFDCLDDLRQRLADALADCLGEGSLAAGQAGEAGGQKLESLAR